MRALAPAMVGLFLTVCASASPVSPVARSELAPTGTLRIGINFGNPVLATKDKATGELRGVTVDIGRELGRRVGAPVELVGYDTIGKMIEGLKAGAWDVGFLAVDPARSGDIGFTAPYMEVEVTYLLAPRSPLRTIADVDRPDMRIAVQAKNAADLFLSRGLKNAQLVRAPDEDAAFALLAAGTAEAYASNKQRLLAVAERLPGSRVVDGRFSAIEHAIGVPRGREAAAGYLRELVEELKASGFVAQAILNAGIRGVVVAPKAPLP